MVSRKFLILITIINFGFLIFILGFGWILYSKYSKITPAQPQPIPESKKEVSPIESTFFSTKFENCLAGKEDPPLNPAGHWPDAFYTLVGALSQREEKACQRLEGTEKNQCLSFLYLFKTLTQNDPKYCENLKHISPFNYQRCLVFTKRDPSYCQNFENPLDKEICLAFFEGIDRCDRLSGNIKAKRFKLESWEFSESKKIEEKEEVIPEKEAKIICRGSLLLVKAILEKNPTLCDLPEVKVDHFNSLICRILSTPEPAKEWQSLKKMICYEKFGPTMALINKDPYFCEQIPFKGEYNRDLYNFCLSQIK
jgi:hypothetical protein